MSEFWTAPAAEPLAVRTKARVFPVHEGKAYIVTGAAGGIGQAVVELLLAEGARVAAWDIRLESLQKTLEHHDPDRSLAIQCDMGSEESIKAAFAQTEQWHPALDGVVNNAATVQRADPLNVSWLDWRKTMDVNVYGAFEASRLLCNSIIARKGNGAVVNVASEAGKKGHTTSIPYAASKAAMISMTRVLASAVAPNDINVNCICPGGVATDMLRAAAANYARLTNGSQDEIFPKLTSSQLRRHIMPLEIARTISFLLTDDAMIIRGQAINTDGGDTPY
ncbi:MAG: SDR family oxidoreductase [Pseudomonadota bacterium]